MHGETLRDIVPLVPRVPHGKFALRARVGVLDNCEPRAGETRHQPSPRNNDGALPARNS
jgi:hypothetical protein